MFFVSLLFNQVLGWVRSQSGTTSLRAILYMDEIFGFLPPVANPPSKAPLLTLLKQARAFGVGVMLATQNPVDLDYKALSNAGTWFIGRLQTERDVARVLDGLEGAAASGGGGGGAGGAARFDRQEMERLIAGLGNRVFLMNNVHEDAPVLFETRWAMSYLRGPLTRNQIKALMDPRKGAQGAETSAPTHQGDVRAVGTQHPAPVTSGEARPAVPPEIPQYFIPLRSRAPAGARLVYRPALLGSAKIYFRDAKLGAEQSQDVSLLLPLQDDTSPVDWEQAEPADFSEPDLDRAPAGGAAYAALPRQAAQPKSYDAWRKALADALYRTRRLDLFKSPSLGEASRPGETERDFRVRLGQAARERRDEAVDRLRQKYAPKLAALAERARRAEQAVQRKAEQARQSKVQTAISFGTTVLGSIFGRKAVSAGTIGRATTAARGVGRSYKESQDVARAQETVAAVRQQMEELDARMREEVADLEARLDPAAEELQTVSVRPKKTDIDPRPVSLVWAPYWERAGATPEPAWL
jgi:hypothetical protein